jgi:predicted DNA-binding WGR domain protein
MAFLARIDPTRNIDRFYFVTVLPSLFGDWIVMREWGRRGSPGTVRLNSYERRASLAGRDMAEGAARSDVDARRAAEAIALQLD